jgi:hypothetical protein
MRWPPETPSARRASRRPPPAPRSRRMRQRSAAHHRAGIAGRVQSRGSARAAGGTRRCLRHLRRSADRLTGLAELAALVEALRDPALELDVQLRRAASLRMAQDDDAAAELARRVRQRATKLGNRAPNCGPTSSWARHSPTAPSARRSARTRATPTSTLARKRIAAQSRWPRSLATSAAWPRPRANWASSSSRAHGTGSPARYSADGFRSWPRW